MKSRLVPSWVWQVLLAAHFVALAWSLCTGSWIFPDSDRYQQAAENLHVHKVLYARPWPGTVPRGKQVQEFTIRPPGYPLALMALRGHQIPVYVLLAQNILSLIVLLAILRWWAARYRPKTKEWVKVLVLIFSFPAQFIYANALMSEILMQGLLVATVGFALLYLAAKSERFSWGSCVSLSMGLLVKPVLFPLAAVAAIAAAIQAWRHRRVSLLLVGLLPAAVTWSYMHWNEQRTGYFHFSSIAEINMLHYNAAGVVRQTRGAQAEEAWVMGVLREADGQPTFAARQKLIETKSVAILIAHPFVYATQHLVGMGTFFLDPGRFDISQFFHVTAPVGGGLLNQIRSRGLVQALGSLPLDMLGLLGVIAFANVARLYLAVRGFRVLGRESTTWRKGRWVVAGTILYVAFLTGPLGAARFMVPVWPLLLSLALAGMRPFGRQDLEAKPVAAVGDNQGQGRTKYG